MAKAIQVVITFLVVLVWAQRPESDIDPTDPNFDRVMRFLEHYINFQQTANSYAQYMRISHWNFANSRHMVKN